MSNAIVYAIFSDTDKIDNLLQWRELLYSVKTLRQYNTDIDVKVYISPPDRIKNITIFPDMHRLEIVPIDNPVTHAIPNKQVARWLDMKYNAAFHCLENNHYGSVLMIDADTVYQSDPQLLFDKYCDDVMYACPDGYEELFSLLKSDTRFMNDGVVIIPRSMLAIKKDLFDARLSYVKYLIEKFDGLVDRSTDLWSLGICWSAFQYGIYNYLVENKIGFVYFDRNDVATLADWVDMKNKRKPTIIHYWSIGYKDFLPKSYLVNVKDTMNKSISAT